MKKLSIMFAMSFLLVGCLPKNGPPTTSVPSTKSVTVSWTASTGVVQGYNIESSTDGKSYKQIQSVSGSAISTPVTNLATGSTYYFRIRAFNKSGDSGYSTVVSVNL